MAVHTFPFDFPLVFLSFPFISFHPLSFSNYCPFVCQALDVSRAIGWDFCFRGASAELPRSFRGKRSDGPIFFGNWNFEFRAFIYHAKLLPRVASAELPRASADRGFRSIFFCFRENLPRSFRELPPTSVFAKLKRLQAKLIVHPPYIFSTKGVFITAHLVIYLFTGLVI